MGELISIEEVASRVAAAETQAGREQLAARLRQLKHRLRAAQGGIPDHPHVFYGQEPDPVTGYVLYELHGVRLASIRNPGGTGVPESRTDILLTNDARFAEMHITDEYTQIASSWNHVREEELCQDMQLAWEVCTVLQSLIGVAPQRVAERAAVPNNILQFSSARLPQA